jgi:hypothetical protein
MVRKSRVDEELKRIEAARAAEAAASAPAGKRGLRAKVKRMWRNAALRRVSTKQ